MPTRARLGDASQPIVLQPVPQTPSCEPHAPFVAPSSHSSTPFCSANSDRTSLAIQLIPLATYAPRRLAPFTYHLQTWLTRISKRATKVRGFLLDRAHHLGTHSVESFTRRRPTSDVACALFCQAYSRVSRTRFLAPAAQAIIYRVSLIRVFHSLMAMVRKPTWWHRG